MSFSISPLQLLKLLSAAIVFFVLMHALMLVADYGLGRDNLFMMRALFDLNREQNLPTLFSTLQLLLAAVLLLVLFADARISKLSDSAYWLGLAMIFAFLAADEFCEWHEKLIGPLRRALHPTGALSFAWVIPYAALVTLVGGIGMEMVGSKIFTVYGWHSLPFDAETMLEEFMEMFGVALFVYALTGLVQSRMGSLRLSFSAGADRH
jgi:hypothetical protein